MGIAARAYVAESRSRFEKGALATSKGFVYVASHDELKHLPEWKASFRSQLKDHRYYDLIEDSLRDQFQCSYLVFLDHERQIRGIQPFFLVNQDLVEGLSPRLRRWISRIRKVFPNFLYLKILMVGCAAGAGHLSTSSLEEGEWIAELMHEVLPNQARNQRASLILLKEFPSSHRQQLRYFSQNGYIRIPSSPMVKLDLDFKNFEDYMSRHLSKVTRKSLRRKFRHVESVDPIELTVVNDLTPYIDEVYPLYLEVYGRAKMRFEKLSKAYLIGLGQLMPERARFFLWRQNGKVIAFSICLVDGDMISDEYIGLEYPIALDLHLYFYTLRDIFEWSMANGYRRYFSTSGSYDPKLHFRCLLEPLDLYVRHTSSFLNPIFRKILPLLEPTRHDPSIMKFPNAADL